MALRVNSWSPVAHICVNKLTNIGSDNGLSPDQRQAIIWANAGIVLIGHLGTNLKWNFIQNSNIFIQENAFENVRKMSAILSQPQCVKLYAQEHASHIIACFFNEKEYASLCFAREHLRCKTIAFVWYSIPMHIYNQIQSFNELPKQNFYNQCKNHQDVFLTRDPFY